ncbi:MAG: ribose-5-phosphate isomerase RpiA [Acidiphilium sp.]|nr:ribose-5-phosphate isomerase RpiA [Acidiphilium sp.]MDD4934824.1 ribose-5-phosphate isomerase RpiA [Acidiphilium sp.]
MTPRDEQKHEAAREAAKLVENGMFVGLGTGSTTAHFIDALSERMRLETLKITCAATSVATERRAAELGIKVMPLDTVVDLAVDGADEIEFGTLHLIKGLGGALLREKQIADSSRSFVVIADESKLVDHLGEHSKLPVEIVEFACARTVARIAELGISPTIRLADANDPYRTDNGNLIVDCRVGPDLEAMALDLALKTIAGVVETGLFTTGCAAAIVGFADGTTRRFEGDHFARIGVAASIATLRQLSLPQPREKPIIAVMGVSASGKSTIGAMLAACLNVPFVDGDDLHPQQNRDKMHAGYALDDHDRLPWLHSIAGTLRSWRMAGSGGVMVSSLLTRRYRDLVRTGCPDLILVNLEGEHAILATRIASRHGHFMPPTLLDSQFATLEPPGPDETVISVRVDASPIEILKIIMRSFSILA